MNSQELQSYWENACATARTYPQVNPAEISGFLSQLQPQAGDPGFLMLTASNEFIKSWVEAHYLDIIKQALLDNTGIPHTVMIALWPGQSGASTATAAAAPQPAPAVPAPEKLETPASSVAESVQPPAKPAPDLDDCYTRFAPPESVRAQVEALREGREIPQQPSQPEQSSAAQKPTSALTFDNFITGDSNRMAYSMAVEVAELPGKTPLNPLFIYGKSGLGKTHLMRAIQNYITTTQPHLKTVYADSGEFLSDYMDASARGGKERSSYRNFKNHYEEADVVLIDDIQYLQDKKQTLNIVFQIFNKLIDQGKQVVLSADRAPKNIDIDERYQSRFNQGGTIDIQPPEIETKLTIVRLYAQEFCRNEGLDYALFPEDVQTYIAEISGSNIRELKSAVLKVVHQINLLNGAAPTISDVRHLLENHFSGSSSRNLTVEDIQGVVEDFFKVSHADIVGKTRAQNVVYPRQIAIYLCRQMLDLPYNTISEKFNRDRATAMHSVEKIESKLKDSRDVYEEVEVLTKMIREL